MELSNQDSFAQKQQEILDALAVLVKREEKNFSKKWAHELIIALSIFLILALIGATFTFHDMTKAVEAFEKDYVKKSEFQQMMDGRKTFKDDVNYNFDVLEKLHNVQLKEIK